MGSIGLIAVDSADSGQGLGKTLVNKACQWLREQNCKLVNVLTQTDNFAAIRLYMAAGFAPVSSSVTLRWAAREISGPGPSQRPGSREKIN